MASQRPSIGKVSSSHKSRNELLAYTRVRDVHLEPVAIDEWITDLVVDEDIPHTISVELGCQGACSVFVDRERLRRAVLNTLILPLTRADASRGSHPEN